VPTLLLSSRYTADSQALWRAALEMRWLVQRLHGYRPPENLESDDTVIYGEALFVTIIAQQLDIALLETSYDWLPKLPYEYRLRDVQLTTLCQARAIQKTAFIKPAGEKTFDAAIYNSGADLPSADYFDDVTPTLVSEVVEWEIEYRCFVAKRQVQTLSPYLRNGELMKNVDGEWENQAPEDADAIAFLKSVLENDAIPFPTGIVLDIGKICGRGWAVVEANPAWGSGIYGNDPIKVLNTLQSACVKAEKMPAEFSCWVVQR
jgi:hypothetical protein